MARPLAVQSSGRPLKVLKQSANNCFSGDVIQGLYRPLQSARRKFLFFAKFQNLTTNFFAAALSILPLCQRSVCLFPRKLVNHVINQSKQQTLSFIVCRRGLRLGKVFPSLLWPRTLSAFRDMNMYP